MIATRCSAKSVRQTSFLDRFLIITHHSSAGWNSPQSLHTLSLWAPTPYLTRQLLFKKTKKAYPFAGLCACLSIYLCFPPPTLNTLFAWSVWRRDLRFLFLWQKQIPKEFFFVSVGLVFLFIPMGTHTS